jgi:hypothetical protein
MEWPDDVAVGANEAHALYQIREWGHEENLPPRSAAEP